MVFAQVHLEEYANRVLNVIKAKFGLKDKSEAINKLAEMYGPEILGEEANDKYVKKVLETAERHMKKYGRRRMTVKDLDKICEMD